TIVDYARRRQAAGVGWPTIAREVGFSVGAITGWTRAARRPSPMRPVAVRADTVVTLPASGVVVVLPNGVRIEGLPVADVPALWAQAGAPAVELTLSELALLLEGCALLAQRRLSPTVVTPRALCATR